jgi:hypothetical protein
VNSEESLALRSLADKLRSFDAAVMKIFEMLPERGRLIGSQQREAQERLRQLKEGLREEVHRRNFTRLEKQWFEPYIYQVEARLTIKTNSVPDWKWSEKLGEAHTDLSEAAYNIERQIGPGSG